MIDEMLQANTGYPQQFPSNPPMTAAPGRQVAVLTCMDARIDTFAAFGLQIGDAHIIRNAGGLPTDDTLRSLAISQRALGTREILVVQHTGCGMHGFDDADFRVGLHAETEKWPTWDVPGFADVTESVRRSIATLRDCAWLLRRDQIRGAVFDVATGTLSEVG